MEKVNFDPHMPQVDIWPDMEKTFISARQAASNPDKPTMAIVTPGHRIVVPIPVGKATSDQRQSKRYANLQEIISGSASQNISVIAMTEVAAGLQDRLTPDALPYTGSRAIPFFGYLMAIGSLGHSILVFEGHSSTLKMGCRGADVLVVDGGMIPFLQSDWITVSRSVMQGGREIIVFQRDQRIEKL
ncbi:hypothetical protein IQ266_06020 [filamentous cyanobacterium LEGE 11480]|uniref:Uncharacterized protein n=1 Tax=Romeriopsis navalis LEGE 11480 TaxID=2777977 RepID=A0A928VKB9_9CYAN|nr:hypothetical protein [Romeriopsis navalis]MBE9029318.1 hypothetical protein [Romeriopsis navalis LEGE 11480]